MSAARDWLLDLALDLWLWARNGPRSYASLLLAWGEQRTRIDDLEEDATRHRHRADAEVRQTVRLRTEVDDLLVRILETTLAVGRIAQRDVEIPSGMPDAHLYYTQDSVDRLLETAREALETADETARHATTVRRLLCRGLPKTTLDAHALASAARRSLEYLDAALESLPSDGDLERAREILAQTLEHTDPPRSDPDRLP